jgi:hypothetical protein
MSLGRHLRLIYFVLTAFVFAQAAQGQIEATLRLLKTQYVVGEPVVGVLTVTNRAGQVITFAGNNRSQWLDFLVKDRQSNPIPLKGRKVFGKMTLKAGQSLSREVDLSQLFQLSEPGNFSVSATVHMPDQEMEGTTTNRVLFTQSSGIRAWSQKIGLPGKPGNMRDYRLLNFNNEEKCQVYAQVINPQTGQNIRTFLLGDVLLLRKPLATVDNQQRMHVLFLATPTMWVHCQINSDGKLVGRQIHQRGDQGDPQLITFGDGSVRVANSIVYDAKAAAETKAKIRRASDRPAGAF